MSGFHKCPVGGCSEKVPNEWAMCKRHWFKVKKDMRDEIWRSYRDGNAGTMAHIQLIQQAADSVKT